MRKLREKENGAAVKKIACSCGGCDMSCGLREGGGRGNTETVPHTGFAFTGGQPDTGSDPDGCTDRVGRVAHGK